jgi:hypothetical protein
MLQYKDDHAGVRFDDVEEVNHPKARNLQRNTKGREDPRVTE